MPSLYIITGSNGAGKSTIGFSYLPMSIQSTCTIFDGDKLYMQKQKALWQQGITAIKESKKLALAFVEQTFDDLVENAIANKSDFVYEGHFTNDSTWDIPRKFKLANYSIHLIFFGLTDTNLSELRVVNRTHEGGHYVQPKIIANNFYGNLEKLNQHFSMFSSLEIVDTSEIEHHVICRLTDGLLESSISVNILPDWFIKYLPAITNLIEIFKANK